MSDTETKPKPRWDSIRGSIQRNVLLDGDRTPYAVFSLQASTDTGPWGISTTIAECRLAKHPEKYKEMLDLSVQELEAWGAR